MSYYNETSPEEFYHYGVLGMKWGVRRYQNKDGTLTPVGRRRMEKALKNAKLLSNTHAHLEDANRTLIKGVKKDQQILVSTDVKKDFSNQIKNFKSLKAALSKKYRNIETSIITKEGKDFVYTILTDPKVGWGAEYITELKVQR